LAALAVDRGVVPRDPGLADRDLGRAAVADDLLPVLELEGLAVHLAADELELRHCGGSLSLLGYLTRARTAWARRCALSFAPAAALRVGPNSTFDGVRMSNDLRRAITLPSAARVVNRGNAHGVRFCGRT